MKLQAVASGFARVFQAAGDMVVYEGGEPYRLSVWPPTGSTGTAPPAGVGGGSVLPSELLRAGGEVVDFTGRTAELDRLRRWRDSADAMGVCLVHGPGGQGKTRLALQAAADWRAQSWVVLGAFHRRDRQAAPAFAVPVGLESAAGVLVVVDYAERWDTSDLLTLLDDTHVGAGRGVRVRVLLLARPTGPWWQNLAFRIRRDLGLAAERFELPPVEDEPGVSRAALFAAARDRFAELLDVPGARTAEPPSALAAEDDYRLVLSVHMAALAAVLSVRRSTEPPEDPVEVSAYLLDRERDHWIALHHRAEDAVTATPDAMGQLVYTATLTGPLGYDDGRAAVGRVGIESAQVPGQLLKDHARCYPAFRGTSEVGGPGTVLEPLYPDRLGEDYLALSTDGHGHDRQPDLWADGAPARLLAPRPDPAGGTVETGTAWTRHALTTLIEAAARWPHLARTQLHPLLRAHPELALSAGGPALAVLARHPDIDPDLLETLDLLLPWGHVDLDIAAAAIADRLCQYRLDTASSDARRALVHENTALRFSGVGQYDRALAHSENALTGYRELFLSDRAAHVRNYARAVTNHTALLAEAGLRAEALPHSFEALAVQQELAALDPDTPSGGLARAVANHARLLAAEGNGAARQYSEEAVALYRRLGDGYGDRRMSDLATVLGDHALRLAEEGNPAEALACSGEALALSRELARQDRSAHLPLLAASLNRHSGQLADLGRLLEALDHSEEALARYRELADANPGAHEFALVLAAGGRALQLVRAGRSAEALSLSEEALARYRELVGTDRRAHLRGCAVFAAGHATLLAQAGRTEEALVRSDEALRLLRELTERNEDAHLPVLADLLAKCGGWLAEAAQPEAALACSEEAAALYEDLAERDRDTHLPHFAAALHNYALQLADVDETEEALACSEYAFVLFRELLEQDRDGYLGAYVRCAVKLGQLLVADSQFTEAVRPLVEAMLGARQLPEEEQWAVGASAGFLHLAYAGAPRAVAAEFRETTGLEMPDWMKFPEL
ncbi:ATP-binding protein [Kitasatospora sp. NA04385]|uniref:tetratricopeptide repeat protein n=1 Tax=Kitasatospora sp. NA04385 TaxID=2742135 RepID=UPI0015914190|nr:tetratricopeptide repeat protein [Kitasatospora sp. NA04385]QKW22467.1 ATP-binding protein [Kitasatospora sp. NA04385]